MYPLGEDVSWDWISVHSSVHPPCFLVDFNGGCGGYIQNVGVLDNSNFEVGVVLNITLWDLHFNSTFFPYFKKKLHTWI